MSSTTATLRKDLSAPGLIWAIRKQFAKIVDSRRQASIRYTLPDTLCAALGMFQFKYPSLLQFDEACHSDDPRIRNLRRLYRLADVASDTEMRKILDRVSHSSLRLAFRAVHSLAQRGKVLEDFSVLSGRLLLAIDGTGQFASTRISCAQCCAKKRKDGQEEFYHQMLAAVIVHPEQKTVLPLDFEPIMKSDGNNKNDCERNAAKRLLASIAAHYPKRQFIVTENGLASNGPHIQMLLDYDMDFILGIKPGGNPTLFEQMLERSRTIGVAEAEEALADGTRRGYRFSNQMPLNGFHPELLVNTLEYWVVDKKEKVTNFSWITNLEISTDNVYELAEFGRSRWKIENETFNVLKNHGYEFEHNYGHGKKNLSSVLGGLMLLAFLCDQLQEHACALFQAARKKVRVKKTLWEIMRSILMLIDIPDWETLWRFDYRSRFGQSIPCADRHELSRCSFKLFSPLAAPFNTQQIELEKGRPTLARQTRACGNLSSVPQRQSLQTRNC